MSEREALEIEVAAHAARVREIIAVLEDVEDGSRQAALLRMELKGRTAAVEIGSSRLKMLRPDA